MKNKELFDRTVGYLVKAYFDDTLMYSDCRGCAVGNIVAGNLGLKLIKIRPSFIRNNHFIANDIFKDSGLWFDAIEWGGSGKVNEETTYKSLKQAELTGYSIEKLAKIEQAFSIGTAIGNEDNENNFEGLMHVVDCLIEIHEGNLIECEEAKSLFHATS